MVGMRSKDTGERTMAMRETCLMPTLFIYIIHLIKVNVSLIHGVGKAFG